ncbi:MAG: 50S ribosomal protein L9 [Patescibacteria group bacterium]|nr:50S ribosomal protein L9 [Patescibacteria group bacterium]MCL5224283.1 50S ribosomal protein L9 [Patescibacteria group bacterium]
MKVILQQDLRGLGRKNDVKDVPEGYARNFLIPRGIAKFADQTALNELKTKAEEHSRHLDAERIKLQDLVALTEKTPLVFKLRVGENNEIFGSVTAKDVKAEMAAAYPGLDQKDFEIKIGRPIKALGVHDIPISLEEGIEGKIKVLVEKV